MRIYAVPRPQRPHQIPALPRKPEKLMFPPVIPLYNRDRDSSVGIATCYGLDGPGIESRYGRAFPHPPIPALGPTQPSLQWVPSLSRG